ncbi:MAG: hypothetical protein PWQ55_747 [Chloroflexota bacterium]|nr:hypothetical protein [Chloroflexota bacterium]
MTEKSKKTSPWLWTLLQVLYFLLLTLAFTRPLYKHLSTHIDGGLGDNLYFIWQIGWFKQAIFDLHQLPFHSFLLNFPYGYNLATTEIAPLQLAFALPFALGGQPVLGYNIAMLLTFVLSGLFMSLWIEHLSGSRWAGLLSGTAYAFLPYHMVHFLSGHLNISAIQWFPLFFWGFTGMLTGEKAQKRNVWLLAIGLSGIALSSQYYLYTTFVVSALILLVYFLFIRRDQFLNGRLWKQFLLAGLLSLPALAVGVVPYALVHRGGEARTLQDVMQFSAGLSDYILPFTRHFLWGKWVWAHFPRDLWNEATLYIGLPLVVLAVIAFLKRKAGPHQTLFRIFLAGFLISLVLSMGTNLTWMEQPVRVDPQSLLGRIFNNPDGLIYLPGYFFFKTVPYYDIMRAWMRIGVFALLFTCAAAGLGLAWLQRRWPKARALLGAAAIGLVLLDFYVTPNAISRVQPREVDLWLAEQPYGGQVQLPLKQSYEEYSLYYTLTSQKPLIGVIRTFPSNRYFELNPLLANFPDATSLTALQEQQITYVVLDEEVYPLTEEFIQACEALGMRFEVSLDGQAVFSLP